LAALRTRTLDLVIGCVVLRVVHGGSAPILRHDRLIGRIDPVMDRTRQRLKIKAVQVEPDAPMKTETARQIAGTINELRSFLGAEE
jgi:uncharacterized protein YcaQ